MALPSPPGARIAVNRPPNGFLRVLPDAQYDRVSAALEPVSVPRGTVLFTRDHPATWLYLPISGIASLVIPLEDGRAVQAAMVGREGIVGVAAGLEPPVAMFDTIVRVTLQGYRASADHFRRCLADDAECRRLVNGYLRALTAQLGQAAACNATHDVRRRLCSTLLSIHDRVDGDRFTVTQETLGEMLGVRRQGVNEAARALQADGSIAYHRGRVTIRDRARLERGACECYRVERTHLRPFLA